MKKLIAGVVIGVLSLFGAGTITMATASAGAARHVASYPPTQARNLPADQVIIVRCATMGSLQGDVGRLDNYRKGMAPAGAWIEDVPGHNTDWMPANQFDAQYRSLVCVVVSVTPPAPTTTVPVATTLPVTSTTEVSPTPPIHHEPHPCPYDAIDCAPHIGPLPCLLPFNDHNRVASGGYGGEPGFLCEPHHPVPPIVTTTTVPVATTLPVTTTTVPVPVTRCVIVRRVQICTLPPSTTTTVAPETTTTEAPTTTTEPEHECPPGEHPEHHGDEAPGNGLPPDHIVCVPDHPIVTTTTVAPETTTTEAETTTTEAETTTTVPESPCTGLDNCHVVCDHDAVGTDDCNICIGTGSCDVIVCPVGFELDAQGNCDIVPEQPIAPETTTTEATATTLPVTTTTAVPTPLSVPHHYGH